MLATNSRPAEAPAAFRVIIADSDVLGTELLSFFLNATENFIVQKAYDFEEMLAKISELGPFDIALINLQQPGFTGLASFKRAVVSNSGGKVALISNGHRSETVDETIALGGYGVIPRTASTKTFVNALRFISSGEVYVSSTERSRASSSECEPVTQIERKVLDLVAAGMTNRRISSKLGIGEASVSFHVSSLLRKLDAANRTDLAVCAVRNGLV